MAFRRLVSIALFCCFAGAYGQQRSDQCDTDANSACDEMSLLQTNAVLQDIALSVAPQSSPKSSKSPEQSPVVTKQVQDKSSQTLPSVEFKQAKQKVLLSDSPTLLSSDFALAVLVFSVTSAIAYLFMSGTYVLGSLGKEDSELLGKLSAEFAGTFVLVFTVSCCCIKGSADWNPTAIAAVLMAAIYATGPVSGGNLNPAVSIALHLTGKMTGELTLQYCAVQILGGIMATFTASLTIGSIPGPVGPVSPYHWGYAVLAEVIYTAMLCFVVLNCAASKKNNPADDGNQFFGLAIAFVIIAGGYPCGSISGAHFNPAVSLGLEMVSGGGIGWGFVWASFQCIAAALAVMLFKVVRPEEFFEGADDGGSYTISCFSEFLGTFMLVFTVGLNLVTGSGATAWSATAALMCMIYSLGDVSGAHFNPAVSLAIKAAGRGKCDWMQFFLYVFTQLVGACCAGFLYSAFHLAGPQATKAFPLAAGAKFTAITGGIGEMLFTLLLAYVVLAVATTKSPDSQKTKGNYFFGLCIGTCVMVGGTCLGKVSGGELNPAVSLGVAVADALFTHVKPDHAANHTSELLWFPTFELIGGILAALVFRMVHAKEFDETDSQDSPLLCKILAEFLGTFYLVLTVGFVSLGGSATWNPLAIALVLTVMIYSTAFVSGANLNPAVSFALACCKKLDLGTMGLYWASQICGGIAAGLVYCSLFNDSVGIEPQPGYTWDMCVLAELLYTTMLCFVVVQSAVSKGNNPEDDGNQFFALAIGFVIIAGGYAVGSISGACFNPAVSLGISVSREIVVGAPSMVALSWGFLWSGFQLIGAVIAALLFGVMRPQDAGSVDSEDVLSATQPTLMVRCLSEFLGVFILVMTVGLNVVTKSPATALSAAGALMSMIYSLGYISGAHFNPAVTLAIVLSGREACSAFAGVVYVLAQVMAAVTAGHLYAAFHVLGPNKADAFPLMPGKGFTFAAAGAAECFFTFVLAYVVLAVATSATAGSAILKKTKQNFFFGLAIAACVIAGGFAIGGVSGGELNPAVSLGISVANLADKGHESSLANFVPFTLWELSGGVMASIMFRLTHVTEYSTELKSKA